jgi:enterochelin esterase family protein
LRTLFQKFWPFGSRRRTSAGTLPFDYFLSRMGKLTRPRERQAWVEAFFRDADPRAFPLLEPSPRPGFGRVVFLYRGATQKVKLYSQLPSASDADHEFTRLEGTDLHYLVRELESDARMDYKFVLESGEWISDPLNPRQVESAFGASSHFWMPEYVKPDIEAQPQNPRGLLKEFSWESERLGNRRPVRVFVPPQYPDAPRERYPAVYVHDGLDYIGFAKVTTLLNNAWAAGRLPSLIAVLVPPVEREKEYGANDEFAAAIAQELVPHVDSHYRTRTEPQWRATLGASMGGLCAVHLAGSYPEVFGNCAGQSSAFFAEHPLEIVPLELASSAPAKPIRIHMDVGTYEAYYHKDLLAGNRRFAEAIRRKGYPLQYLEVHEGHSWGSWRARVVPALEFFWGKAK